MKNLCMISIHAPRTGSDSISMVSRPTSMNFNPRSPHGERPSLAYFFAPHVKFQSTLPARGATLNFYGQQQYQYISIHAPRTGSDLSVTVYCFISVISIHAPRTGSDMGVGEAQTPAPISIHAPRTGSDVISVLLTSASNISIHAPRTGSDRLAFHTALLNTDFNPRSPHGERRGELSAYHARALISIHAPRTGSDKSRKEYYISPHDFNPRSPHGERPGSAVHENAVSGGFQSTLPARGATFVYGQKFRNTVGFQSTLPARGATRLIVA